jgi:ferredoxin-fold anticodon binding domain-containing protein
MNELQRELLKMVFGVELNTNTTNMTDNSKESKEHRMVGKYCVIRTYSAGVHAGTVESVIGTEVILKEKQATETLRNEINENLLNNIPSDPALKKEFLATINYAMKLMNNPKELKKFKKN